ncbi:unnamed protein product [Caretta caretta]
MVLQALVYVFFPLPLSGRLRKDSEGSGPKRVPLPCDQTHLMAATAMKTWKTKHLAAQPPVLEQNFSCNALHTPAALPSNVWLEHRGALVSWKQQPASSASCIGLLLVCNCTARVLRSPIFED